MIALSGRGDEEDVIGEAVKIAQASDAQLTAVHVNDPHAGEMSMMMESPGPRLEEKDIRDRFRKNGCLLYTSPSPRAATLSRMPSSA